MVKHGINVFISSRQHPEDISDSFQNSPKMKLWARDEDIKSYIEHKIDESPRARRLIVQGPSNLKDKIVSELTDCAKGM